MKGRRTDGPTDRRTAVVLALTLAALGALGAQDALDAQNVQPAWTRGGTCYEVFVRSFQDSDGDGIGDLTGLTSKLDYIKGLGADCIWLMPIARSPSYHGYDVSDYYTVEPAYGTNADFRRMVREAHRRGIVVLVDFVPNHTSNQNPWFEAASRDTASPYRSWYRFSPTPLDSGPWGAGAWRRSAVRNEYYYGAFSPAMPDLDYHTPAVRAEMEKVATFWLREMGADGFRLDAIKYIVEDGPCMQDCAGTHQFLHQWAEHVQRIHPGAYSVGEAWGPISQMLPYYPDQLTSYFGFELADSLLAGVRDGRATGLLAGYLRLQDTLPAWRWSPFLSNHDGNRTMSLLGGDFAKAKLAATLLLTLPGLPFVYYGEEIGMTGMKPDPRLRTPMQWRAIAGGAFTRGTPWEAFQPDSFTTTVEAQDKDSSSLLNLYRRLIHLRRQNPALADGRLVPVTSSSAQVEAYLRVTATRAVLVLANLGASAAGDLTISSRAPQLRPGRYTARGLLGGAGQPPFGIDCEPELRATGLSLEPHEFRVLELVRR